MNTDAPNWSRNGNRYLRIEREMTLPSANTAILAGSSTFDYGRPAESDVKLWEIIDSLGKLCRYAGHVPGFYSVLEHSFAAAVLVAALWRTHPGHSLIDTGTGAVTPIHAPAELVWATFAHDFAEALTVDVPRPAKRSIPGFKAWEEPIEERVRHLMRSQHDAWAMWIGSADLIMYGLERRHLFGWTDVVFTPAIEAAVRSVALWPQGVPQARQHTLGSFALGWLSGYGALPRELWAQLDTRPVRYERAFIAGEAIGEHHEIPLFY